MGRFGLGFNAVYNLTEVPSIYSGNVLAMLDPQEYYLDNDKPIRGKKMNFDLVINQLLLKHMPNQFRPFHGIFGNNILNGNPFNGTLFRFPLRTITQSKRSELCREVFTTESKNDFIESLQSKAGNLLLFTQNVKKLELYHLSHNATDPNQATCLLVVEKISSVSNINFPYSKSGILTYFSEKWNESVKSCSNPIDLKVMEDITVTIEENVPGRTVDMSSTHNRKSCKFHIVWTLGTAEANKEARIKIGEGYLPLAAVAIPVDIYGHAIPIHNSPKGKLCGNILSVRITLLRPHCK